MNRKDFLEQLNKELFRLPKEERDAAVSYYEEFFIEAGEDDEAAVAERLGDVRALAKTILLESGINVNPASSESEGMNQTPPVYGSTFQPQPEQSSTLSSPSRTLLYVVLAIVTFPFWFSILMTVFGLIIAGAAVIFALIVTAIVLGTVGIGYGIYSMTFSPAIGFLMVGASLIVLGIILLIVFPLAKAFSICTKYIFKGIGRLFKSVFHGNEVTA
jgi:uncharacterized membrane protein